MLIQPYIKPGGVHLKARGRVSTGTRSAGWEAVPHSDLQVSEEGKEALVGGIAERVRGEPAANVAQVHTFQSWMS